MRIGVVKEIKQAERRVALTPAGAQELVALGTRFRRGRSGCRVGLFRRRYKIVGAQIVPAAQKCGSRASCCSKSKSRSRRSTR